MKTKKPMYSPDQMEFWWQYAKSSDFNARWSIFGRDNQHEIPAEILAYLANDEDWVIRVEVAAYAKTPIEILKHLAINNSYGIRTAIYENPNCTDEIRLLILAKIKYGHLTNRHR